MSESIESYLLLGLVLSLAGTLGALVSAGVILVILVKLPADYFCRPVRRGFSPGRHPIVGRAGVFLKNVVGAGVAAFGVVLAIPGIPGPGVLTLVIGLLLIDAPELRRLERWFLRRPLIVRAVNALRQRYGKPPLLWRSSTPSRK
jgi:hypothetical protein